MLVNRAKMTTATTGTGTITLGSAVDGYQSFADAGVTDAAVVSYAIEDGTAWEIGTGTYTASGTTLSRTVSESSNAGAAITLTGNAVVFVTARAEDLATGGGAPTLATSSGATQSVDFSTSNKIHVATIDADAILTFDNPASIAKLDLILDVGASAYDFANVSYDDIVFSVAAQEGQPRDVAVGATGTKLYVLGGVTDTIYQYSISNPSDLSTASYDSVSLSVAAQDANPQGIAFSEDGTKLYYAGNDTKRVFQYALSTAWDLSTAVYSGNSFLYSNFIYGMDFDNTGTLLYLLNSAGAVVEIALSTAWDITTASATGNTFSVSSQGTTPYGLHFFRDGSGFLVIYLSSRTIVEFAMSTSWTLTSASATGNSINISAQETNPYSLCESASGTKLFVVGNDKEGPFSYSMGGAYTFTLPANLQSPTIPTGIGQKTALQIVTYDGGTTYQAINVQGGIV